MIIEAVRRTTRTDCGHGCVIRRAGEARASAPIRALVAVFVALLSVHFMSGTAYADSVNAEIISGPSVVPFADMYGASIAAPDRYTAAAMLMGYGPESISGWDDDVKSKLSNAGTGGQFYVFANNSVQNYFDITEHTGIFQDFFNFVGGAFWNTAQSLYGNNLWAALYTPAELASAKADLERVLSGEDIGGGSGGGSGGVAPNFPLTVTLEPGEKTKTTVTNEFWFYFGNRIYTNDVSKIQVNLTNSIQLPSGDFDMFVVVYPSNSNNTPAKIHIFLIPVGEGEIRTENGLTGVYLKSKVTYYRKYEQTVPSGTPYSFTDHVLTFSYDISGAAFWSVSGSVGYISNAAETNGSTRGFFFSSVNAEPVVPPTNWPDEPSAPTPPELPEPGTDPIVTPTPWAPVISPTFDFDLNITTEPNSNDLIDWVKKIYFELRSFHTDAQDWFDEVGKGIDGVVKAVDDAQKQIYSELQTIDDTLRDEGQKIRDYMYQMFHWLKDQLNFQNDTFNDSNIVYWLKRIWSKLGNGDINVRPTDPTTDPTGVWDWLIKLIQNFLIGLASSANDLISEMADLVSQVMHEFPFSIPWDIAAFLAAFAAAPITPDVDVTIPAIEGWWGETVISIDLSPYDTAAAAVRAMEKILFAAFLAWKSKDLLEFMDVTKWFNG